jgi:very-short-patch-repair endonuclease
VGGVGGGGVKEMTSILTINARKLRKDSTRAESLLWSKLRAKQIAGIKFRRQQPIGYYIVDFVSFEKKIIIELDGGQHAKAKKKDSKRDKFLNENGFTVLRFWNNDIFSNLDGV